MSEKILARAAGSAEVNAGDIIWANIDMAMLDDILGPRVEIAEKMLEIKNKVWDADKVVVISDHYTPPASVAQAEIVKFTRKWSEEQGVENYYEFIGPCHQIMVERGHILPGKVILGTDSHTCMGGAFGAFSTGVGSTEMLGVLLTGKTWFKVPKTVLVEWTGHLADRVMAKDISLKTIGVIGHSGATYKAVEYIGDTIKELSMDERMTITNMAVEMGAKVGLMSPDDTTYDFLRAHGQEVLPTDNLYSDADAKFESVYRFLGSDLEPQVACPHQVDNVTEARNLNSVRLDQVYIGSCTGGRMSDLKAAAEILNGKRIAKGLRLLISPASDRIWQEACENGVFATLVAAGACVLAPTCGVCVGLHSGLLASGENCLSTSNRNFIGRMGSKEAGIYLGSAATAAASALTGRITDPRDLLSGIRYEYKNKR
jgi:3-isopropylmalate/(R)-2-methylmalate dehydratase large subunit